ncbi:hypothetical protein NHQ30_006124 [Ciborinia camelliae]|nr:hypothetical protein NHQ30_006124 [Ciborinia camelliae]
MLCQTSDPNSIDKSRLVYQSATEDPTMEPERKQGRSPRWQSKELVKLKEIVRNFGIDKKGGPLSAFWQNVSTEMKVYGYDRQASALYHRWNRLNRKLPSTYLDRTSTMWDISDSDGAEDEEDIKDEEGDESDIGPENVPKDDVVKPWATGNNWSEEEDAVAFKCIKGQRDREAELKVEPISADQLWHMVSESLASHGFYRKTPNIYRYWTTKGREKHNLDAKAPSAIERAPDEALRISGKQPKQIPSKPAARRGNPSNSVPVGSTEESFQVNSAEATPEDAQPLKLSSQQHNILRTQYSKYNHLDNPVVIQLEKETGLNREQIKRSMDTKEAEAQTVKELSSPLLGDIGSKRHRVSDIGFQSQVEEKPVKKSRHSLGSESLVENYKRDSVDFKAQNEAFDYHPPVAGLSVPADNDPAVSTIEVQHTSQLATQRETSDHASQMTAILTAEREMSQQKMLAAEEEYRQLKLAIVAHKEKAAAELEVANTKEQELAVQEEIQKKIKNRIAHIDIILND